ncbi:pseudouridine synthase deg1 [Binucleata daphniae]
MSEQVKICIRFSYDGTRYCGSALQKFNENTVTNDIVKALVSNRIYKENPVFAGRTDKGVSASNMVASFYVKNIEKMNYAAVIQTFLPSTIIVAAFAIVNDDFDARHDCTERHYKYVFRNQHDIEKMQSCCEKILRFTSFINLCKKSEERSLKQKDKKLKDDYYKRKLNDLTITILDNKFCVMDVKGRSFLHNMVRKIFWLVKNYATGTVDDDFVEKVKNEVVECGTESPENLIFYKATYTKEIAWIINHKNKQKLQQIYEEKLLATELLKIKLE